MGDEQALSRKQRVRAAYEEASGEWSDELEAVLELDPDLAEAYQHFAAVPARGRLEPLVRELVSIAANASVTLMHEPALRLHLRNAIALGASREQLVEVLELVSVAGIHAVSMGMPVLAEELARNGDPLDEHLTERQQQAKQAYIDGRDAWAPWCESWVRLAPDLLEAYAGYSMVPWKKGELPPKVKELLYIAIDSVATHLYEAGTRFHVDKALALGASREEIAEVFAVVATVGFHACTLGVPLLLEEWERHEAAGRPPDGSAGGQPSHGLAGGTSSDGLAGGTSSDGLAGGTSSDGLAGGTSSDGLAGGTPPDGSYAAGRGPDGGAASTRSSSEEGSEV